MREILIKTGRIFYCACLAGLALQQFLYPGFRPVFLPPWVPWISSATAISYLFGVILLGAVVLILLNKYAPKILVVTGMVLLVLVVFVHLPYRLIHNPLTNSDNLGLWTDLFKLLALSGSAFIVANSFRDAESFILPINLFRVGCIFLSIMLIIFGVDHFLYTTFVATLVPDWIPGHIFWTYFAGVALIGSGVSILLNIRVKEVSILLGVMIFLWLILLHIPRAVADPCGANGNEVTSVFEALGFSGVAFVLAFENGRQKLINTIY